MLSCSILILSMTDGRVIYQKCLVCGADFGVSTVLSRAVRAVWSIADTIRVRVVPSANCTACVLSTVNTDVTKFMAVEAPCNRFLVRQTGV